MPSVAPRPDRSFPLSAGLLFGLGLGGFFDGIVLINCSNGIICSAAGTQSIRSQTLS